jgi:ubiquinol oxidase
MDNKNNLPGFLKNEQLEHKTSLTTHRKPKSLAVHFAYFLCKGLRKTADIFFQKRYGHRAVVLETVAAVPGMIGAMVNSF